MCECVPPLLFEASSSSCCGVLVEDAPVAGTTTLAILEVLVGEADTRSRHCVVAMPKSMVAVGEGAEGADAQL